MTHYKILALTLLATLASCEPPVQGYDYRRPAYQNSYSAPSNQYLPPSAKFVLDRTSPDGYTAPSNNYLPPPSFGTGPAANYENNGFSTSGHDYDQHAHGHGHGHGHGHDNEVPKSYEFGYSVKDAQSGNDYGRHETSDGNVVRGEYRVQLPDGRTQIVTYHADWQTGFHADVRYEGEAHYPEPVHHQQQQGYNYNTPSDFSGSLTGFGNRNYKPSPSYGPPGYH